MYVVFKPRETVSECCLCERFVHVASKLPAAVVVSSENSVSLNSYVELITWK